MRDATVWRRALGVDTKTVIDKVVFEEEGDEDVVIVRVRRHRSRKLRCGKCSKVAGRYDKGEGRRRWRAHDIGLLRCYLEGEAPRVRCPTHGPVVAQVPWARHDARHTYAFDDQVAWLVTHTAKTTLVELMRIWWPTVGAIVTRVVADGRALRDPFDGLVRIGIDEISYKRGHKYITVVVDHDSGRLVWAAPGRDKETLSQFFELLGPERSARIRLVSADAAEVDRHGGRRALPRGHLVRGPVPHGRLGHVSPRRSASPAVARRQAHRCTETRHPHQGMSLRPGAPRGAMTPGGDERTHLWPVAAGR